MPLTELQSDILAVISSHRTPENYIAGGTALHFEPNSSRFSRDLDIFHDSLEAVAPSYEQDRKSLEGQEAFCLGQARFKIGSWNTSYHYFDGGATFLKYSDRFRVISSS